MHKRGVLTYIRCLLNTHHVKGFGGIPPPSPAIHQYTVMTAPTPSRSHHARLIPNGLSDFMVAQMVEGDDTAAWTATTLTSFPPTSDNPLELLATAALYRHMAMERENIVPPPPEEGGAESTEASIAQENGLP
eukprot:jgi/Mesvir1/11066/Mv12675-RA.1